METIKALKASDQNDFQLIKHYKIKTDVLSIRANLLKEIQPPDYVIVENKGVKLNFKPVNTLKSFTLERLDEIAKSKEPEGDNLRFLLNFTKKCKIFKANYLKNFEEDSAANNWSVYSDAHMSEREDEKESNRQRKQANKVNRLRKKSTIVPNPIQK